MWGRENTALRRQLCRGSDCHQIHSLQDSRSFTEIRILLGKAGKTPILLAEEYIKSVQTLLVYFHWGGGNPTTSDGAGMHLIFAIGIYQNLQELLSFL